MTIDEAIKLLEKRPMAFPYSMREKCNEAIDMAISALCAQQEAEKMAQSGIWNVKETMKAVANEPLTLDELREMDGQPVWIKQQDGFITGAVIDKVFDRVIAIWATGQDGIEREKEYGKTWFAYRHQPKCSTIDVSLPE